MTRQQEDSLPRVDKEIRDETLRWVHQNRAVTDCPTGYSSPRISSELTDCALPCTFDQYSHCSLGCTYCFAYFFQSNNPSITDHSVKSIDPDKLLADIRGESTNVRGRQFYKYFYSRRFVLHWGGLADPFCNFERKFHIGRKLIAGLAQMAYPTLFSFKGAMLKHPRMLRLFERFADQKSFAFQTSIITADNELSRKIEIGVPSSNHRLAMMKTLSDMGYYTILRLRPFIIGLSDDSLLELLQKAKAAGARAVSLEFLAIDTRANVGMKKRYEWIARLIGTDNLHKYFTRLSPSERGGYCRLNRDIKEEHVKLVWEFCHKHGMECSISDPDFKELNTTGCCCGLPETYPANPDLCNWTRAQLTYHLKEARRTFHATGEAPTLRFDEVYKGEPYLDDEAKLVMDHVYVVPQSTAVCDAMTLRKVLQLQWNNLRSPSNPRNYLHGKVMPTGDDGTNLIYTYQEHPYERRWKAEGIDLT